MKRMILVILSILNTFGDDRQQQDDNDDDDDDNDDDDGGGGFRVRNGVIDIYCATRHTCACDFFRGW